MHAPVSSRRAGTDDVSFNPARTTTRNRLAIHRSAAPPKVQRIDLSTKSPSIPASEARARLGGGEARERGSVRRGLHPLLSLKIRLFFSIEPACYRKKGAEKGELIFEEFQVWVLECARCALRGLKSYEVRGLAGRRAQGNASKVAVRAVLRYTVRY